MLTSNKLGVIAGAAILVAGCAGHDDQETTATTTTASLDPAATSRGDNPVAPVATGAHAGGVFVRLDSPMGACDKVCEGPFWVRELNDGAPAQLVSQLDLTGLPSGSLPQAVLVAAGELVLRGAFSSPSDPDSPTTFVAVEAWRGMPGAASHPRELYATIGAVGEHLYAQALDGTGGQPVNSFDLSALAALQLDTEWLNARLVAGGAIVNGQIEGTTLEATQVFVQLPDEPGLCPLLQYSCGAEVATFSLAPDRCLIPTGCAKREACPDLAPACEAGYALKSWPAQPDACLAYTCQPLWLAR